MSNPYAPTIYHRLVSHLAARQRQSPRVPLSEIIHSVIQNRDDSQMRLFGIYLSSLNRHERAELETAVMMECKAGDR